MIKTLTLKNFRKHEDKVLQLTPGLNVLRGENEIGKSTISESVGYAFFGARALREAFSEVVTYDQPEGSLRVMLEFSFDSVDYTITRGKSGAELVYGDQRVTGQTEVTKFVERLLGCSADVMSSLQMASQNKVRGVLESDGAAGGLVEKLAQLGVIETIIDKIQTQLPTGNTKSVLSAIDFIESNPLPEPIPGDSVPVEKCKTDLQTASISVQTIEAKVKALDTAKALDTQNKYRTAVDRNRMIQRTIERLNIEAAAKPAVPETSEAELARWKLEAATEEMQVLRRKHYATTIPEVPEWLDRNVQEAKAKSIRQGLTDAKLMHSALKQDRRVALSLKITEKECAFCKKDLSDVPEVIALNAAKDEAIQKMDRELEALDRRIAEYGIEILALEEIERLDSQIQKNFSQGFWNLDMTKIPAVPSWIGDVPTVAGQVWPIASVETAWRLYHRDMAVANNAEKQLRSMGLEIVPDTTEADAVMAEYNVKVAELKDAERIDQAARLSLVYAEGEYKEATAKYSSEMRRIEDTKVQLATHKKTLAEMTKHNELVKRLREARPQIATQLWGTVLSAISHYFSSVRGTAGMVTRDADGFKVNGRSVQGLSGSTLDALGLGIRIALSKVFLPNVPFLFLDEPFSGADSQRELNGLGTIAAAGFDQTILVTHSDLADSIADNLIML